MELIEARYRLIEDCLPRQRGNAILYVAEQGRK